jgi:hypothetical protein
MWQDILKIEPYEMAVAEEFAPEDMKEGRDKRQMELAEGESKKVLDKTIKLDNYVKNDIYGLMTEQDRELYDKYLNLIRGATRKNDYSAAHNLRVSLLHLLKPYNLPRRLP